MPLRKNAKTIASTQDLAKTTMKEKSPKRNKKRPRKKSLSQKRLNQKMKISMSVMSRFLMMIMVSRAQVKKRHLTKKVAHLEALMDQKRKETRIVNTLEICLVKTSQSSSQQANLRLRVRITPISTPMTTAVYLSGALVEN